MSLAPIGSTAAVNAGGPVNVPVAVPVLVVVVLAGARVDVGVGRVVDVAGATVAVVLGAVDAELVGADAAGFVLPHAASRTIAATGVKQTEIVRSRRIFLRLPAVLRALLAAIAATALVAACGGSSSHSTATTVPPTAARITTTTRAPVSTTSAPTSTTAAPTTTAAPAPVTTASRPPATPPPTTSAPTPPVGPASAAQAELIVVSASGYGQTFATLNAYDRTSSGWVRRFGPWTARVGRNGFAPDGQKREGDGRTPSGTYGFSFFFGIDANPGVSFAYRPITSSAIVWDDDPGSPNYNEWIDTRVGAAGVRPEPMYNAPVYDYGAVIAYNTPRTPGLGSAIFFHVSDGQSTAGCVALPVSELLDVLRWMNPALNPQMRMGVNAAAPA